MRNGMYVSTYRFALILNRCSLNFIRTMIAMDFAKIEMQTMGRQDSLWIIVAHPSLNYTHTVFSHSSFYPYSFSLPRDIFSLWISTVGVPNVTIPQQFWKAHIIKRILFFLHFSSIFPLFLSHHTKTFSLLFFPFLNCKLEDTPFLTTLPTLAFSHYFV